MGKYALLLTLAGMLGVTLLAQQSQHSSTETSESQGERQGTVIARQIARSAFSDGLSAVKRSFDTITDSTSQGNLLRGTYTLTFDASTSGGETVIDLQSEGMYGAATYRITGRAEQDTALSSLTRGITASTPITFTVKGGGCSGGPCVSGIDAGGREDRHGITIPPDEDPSTICEEFDDKVEGKEEGCDVKSRTGDRAEWIDQEMERLEQEINDAVDSGSEEVTVCNTCNIGDLATDSGILYVTGELTYNGEEQWNGLVFMGDGGSVRINGGGDVANINGGLVLDDSTSFDEDEEFDMNGGNAVKYNSDELRKYMNSFPTLRETVVTVRDRSGHFLTVE